MKPAALRPCLIIDTREQVPLEFSDAVDTVRMMLPEADYSVLGLQHEILIERKSFVDLLGSGGSGRARFEADLKRMASYRQKILLVETTWDYLLAGRWLTDPTADGAPSTITPTQVFGWLIGWTRHFGIPPVLAGTHAQAGQFAERYLLQSIEEIRAEHRVIRKLADAPQEYLVSAAAAGVDPAKIENWSPMDLGDPLAAADNRFAKSHLDFARRKGA